MTKSEKIANNILNQLNELTFQNPLLTDKQISVCVSIMLKPHLEHIHNEAVLATIMAKNKKIYEEPKYID